MGILDSIGSLFGSDSLLGVVGWTNPGNVRARDDSYSSAILLLGQQSNYLKVQGFGFTIPLDAVITGVRVEIERNSTLGLSIKDASVRLYKQGVLLGDDKADLVTNWATTDASAFYGSSTDNWGWTTMTPSDMNDAGFGVGISAVASLAAIANVDYVNVTVYYTGSNTFGNTDLGGSYRAASGISVTGQVF